MAEGTYCSVWWTLVTPAGVAARGVEDSSSHSITRRSTPCTTRRLMRSRGSLRISSTAWGGKVRASVANHELVRTGVSKPAWCKCARKLILIGGGAHNPSHWESSSLHGTRERGSCLLGAQRGRKLSPWCARARKPMPIGQTAHNAQVSVSRRRCSMAPSRARNHTSSMTSGLCTFFHSSRMKSITTNPCPPCGCDRAQR